MADLFIVKERLKLSLWLVGTGFFGSLLATWYFMRQTGFDGEEGNFCMAAVVTGALALAWVGLLAFSLFAKRVVDPGHHNPGALDRVPWWLVKMLLLIVFIAAMGYGLKRFSRFVEGEFALLRSDDIAMLEMRIKKDPALLEKAEGKAGATLVQVAFRENHPQAVAMLLENGAAREGLDVAGRNPVVDSLENLPMLGTLLQAGFDPDEKDADGVPPIHYAVSLHLADAIEALLGAGAKIDAHDAGFRTPLIRAIETDDLPMAGTLLENGADVNAYDRRGDTPLHKAARRRSAAGIRLLLEHGADPRIFNFIHLTPLHIAALGGHDELVSIFLELPDMTGLLGENDRTPLDLALKARKYDTAELLIASGADINRILANGDTLLHELTLVRDYRTVRFLIRAGGDVYLQNAKGETAHDIMRRKQLHGLLELIEQRDNPEAAITNVVESVENVP